MVKKDKALHVLASDLGMNANTLRYWITSGLLPAPTLAGKNPVYAPAKMLRPLIQFIQRMIEKGDTVNEIAVFLKDSKKDTFLAELKKFHLSWDLSEITGINKEKVNVMAVWESWTMEFPKFTDNIREEMSKQDLCLELTPFHPIAAKQAVIEECIGDLGWWDVEGLQRAARAYAQRNLNAVIQGMVAYEQSLLNAGSSFKICAPGRRRLLELLALRAALDGRTSVAEFWKELIKQFDQMEKEEK